MAIRGMGRALAEPKPGDEVPTADADCLRELGATETWPRTLEYWHKDHTLDDLMVEGYFAGDARDRLNVGDTIHYTMRCGSKLPSEWQRGICCVEEKPNTKELPLVLAGFERYSKPTPWRLKRADEADKAA